MAISVNPTGVPTQSSGLKRTAACWGMMALAVEVGCGAKVAPDTVQGDYSADGTVVIAGPLDPGAAMRGRVDPPAAVKHAFAISQHGTNPAEYHVLESASGCRLTAILQPGGRVLAAEDAVCAFAPDAPLLQLVPDSTRTFKFFRMDFGAGSWEGVTRTYWGPQMYWGREYPIGAIVSTGSIVKGAMKGPAVVAEAAPLEHRFRYDGTYVWYTERPAGGTVCDFRQPDWPMTGYVTIRTDATGSEMTIEQEAIGCTLLAHSSGNVFVGASQSCTFTSPVSVGAFGVLEKKVDHVRYDPSSRRLQLSGTIARAKGDGAIMVTCFEEDVSLTEPPPLG